jgi:hypothetical protein
MLTDQNLTPLEIFDYSLLSRSDCLSRLLNFQKGSKDINKFAKKLDIGNKAESPYLSIPLAKAQYYLMPYIKKNY